MPELPEVEALATFLREQTVGLLIDRVDVTAISVLKTVDPPISGLVGREVSAVDRHGKFLDIDASGWHLVVHLARAGWLHWRDVLATTTLRPALRPGRGPLALRVGFASGAGFDLTEAGTQKRLSVAVLTDPMLMPGVARLGVDPLDPRFTVGGLAEVLRGAGRAQLKGVLTDQTLIAGIGNAYSDEILHAARLSPFKPANGLRAEEVTGLHVVIVGTLLAAVSRSAGHPAESLKSEKKSGLRVHGHAGQPCPVCADTIREVSYADRSLQYCPGCQTAGRPLADRRLSRLLK